MQKRLLFILFVGLVFSHPSICSVKQPIEKMELFNRVVANKGKDAANHPKDMSITFQCDDIKQVLTVNGENGVVQTKVEGVMFSTFMSTPSFPDGLILPDDISDADGWDYYFRSSSGYLTFITKNNGKVKIRVKSYTNGKESEVERDCKIAS
ncbi:hypothetical protein [Enterobacter roggenkampii]|uniref:hypothetical protein n=1 Tax=Enterobacter roggenkampii TaxID=1812935 RepID=UPI002A7FA3EB|nr:hypothetical protein [Enterobacter roggenkampii]